MKRFKSHLTAAALTAACAFAPGCLSIDADDEGAGPTPTASGTLTVAVANGEARYMLEREDGVFVRLNLDSMTDTAPGAEPSTDWRTASGSPVDVFGTVTDDGAIVVDTMRPAEGIGELTNALVTTGTKRVLVLRVQFDGGQTMGTEQDVRNTMAAAATHLAGSSFGKMQLEYDLAGPFNITFGKCDDYDRWQNEARTAAKNAGFNLNAYQHYMIMGKMDCGYAGMGAQPGNATWMAGLWPEVVVHELGHNFGLWHASSRTCRSGGATVTMSNDCTFDEYGDIFDPMGDGGKQHYNANYKVNLGWIPSSQVQTVTADGTYTLAPMTESSTGIQLLRVKGPNDIMYQIEFRQPAATNVVDSRNISTKGVLIHAFFTQSRESGRAHLLDMVPGGNFRDAPLVVGASHQLFGTNATLKLLSVSATGAQVQISGLGAGTGDPGGNPGGGTGGAVGQSLAALHSGKCMSVNAASLDNGATVVQRPCTGASDQQWQVEIISGTTATVKNVNSGKCADVQGSSRNNGANITQADCNSGKNSQKWDLIDRGNGVVSLRSVNSGKCVDVYGASTADGARLAQYTCNNGTNQQFRRQ